MQSPVIIGMLERSERTRTFGLKWTGLVAVGAAALSRQTPLHRLLHIVGPRTR